ncbi:hypothetical protein PHLCEN_2v9106, partial [Hermanssonia centrifuga]
CPRAFVAFRFFLVIGIKRRLVIESSGEALAPLPLVRSSRLELEGAPHRRKRTRVGEPVQQTGLSPAVTAPDVVVTSGVCSTTATTSMSLHAVPQIDSMASIQSACDTLGLDINELHEDAVSPLATENVPTDIEIVTEQDAYWYALDKVGAIFRLDRFVYVFQGWDKKNNMLEFLILQQHAAVAEQAPKLSNPLEML